MTTMSNEGYAGGGAGSGRERLLAAALDLFLEAGYDGVSMQQIADAAAMTKGAPYHHFSSKEDLFGQALARHFDQVQSGFRSRMEGTADLRERMIEGFSYLIEHSDAGMMRLVEDLRRLVGPDRMNSYGVTIERLRVCNRWVFEEAQAAGVPLSCSPDEAADLFLAVQIGELSLLEIETRFELSPDVIRRRALRLVDMLLAGLIATPSPLVPAHAAPMPSRPSEAPRDDRC